MRTSLAAALVAGFLLAAAPALAVRGFVITGRGWGHGIGMSQYGAEGFAQHGWSYRRILAHYYPGTRLKRTGNRTVRVLVVAERRQVTIRSHKTYRITDAAGRAWTLHPREVTLTTRGRVQIRGKRRALRFPVVFEPGATVLSVNGNAYRGRLRVLRDGRRLDVVNDVRMEFYVRGVVPWEMPYRWHLGALAAQAVAARSFALAELGSRGTFDLYPDTRDQMYGGVRAETTRTNRAVASTARQVLVWNGAVARTYYSSTSGGRTQALPGVPYLRSVSDPYDRISPHHRWGPLRYSRRQLGRLLHLPAPTAVHVARNLDGRARSVYVRWRGGGSSVSASDFQRRLGLRSTWFWVGPVAPSRPAAEARARAKNRTRQSATSHRRRKPQHRQA